MSQLLPSHSNGAPWRLGAIGFAHADTLHGPSFELPLSATELDLRLILTSDSGPTLRQSSTSNISVFCTAYARHDSLLRFLLLHSFLRHLHKPMPVCACGRWQHLTCATVTEVLDEQVTTRVDEASQDLEFMSHRAHRELQTSCGRRAVADAQEAVATESVHREKLPEGAPLSLRRATRIARASTAR